MELLNAIMIITKCKHAEQLKNLSTERKVWLAHSIEERVPSGLASIEEWNEVLMYLVGAPPESKKEVAKKKILCFLRDEEYKEEPTSADRDRWWSFSKDIIKE